MGSLTKDGSSSSSSRKKKSQQQQHQVELLSNSSDEYERMLMNLIDQLQGIRLHALALERWHAPQLKKVHRCVTRSIFHFSQELKFLCPNFSRCTKYVVTSSSFCTSFYIRYQSFLSSTWSQMILMFLDIL
jgi:hypothetical protein